MTGGDERFTSAISEKSFGQFRKAFPGAVVISPSEDVLSGELLTLEQVRRAANVYVESIGLPPRIRQQLYQDEVDRQTYHARRNAQASKSHRKTRNKRLAELGIDPDRIKSVSPKKPP